MFDVVNHVRRPLDVLLRIPFPRHCTVYKNTSKAEVRLAVVAIARFRLARTRPSELIYRQAAASGNNNK